MDYSQLAPGDNPQQEREAAVVVTTNSGTNSVQEEMKRMKYRRYIYYFAVTELVLGSICVIFGAAIAGIVADKPYFSYRPSYCSSSSFSSSRGSCYTRYISLFTTGEGLWCGVWIIVAGALGVRSGQKNASNCMKICHMSFSIVGSVFAGVMVMISGFASRNAGELARRLGIVHLVILYSILCFCAFISMVLLILSSVYTGKLVGCCSNDYDGCCGGANGCGCCEPYPDYTAAYGGQVVYTQQPQASGNPMMVVPQQQGGGAQPSGQRIMYAGQPAIVYPQQSVGGQSIVYAQQPTAPYGGAPNIPQGYVVQGTQPAIQGYQPMQQGTQQVVQAPTSMPNQPNLTNPNPHVPVAQAE